MYNIRGETASIPRYAQSTRRVCWMNGGVVMNRCAVVTIRNIAGFFVGIITFYIVSILLSMVLGFIVSLPIVASILSFPSTPELYFSTGVNLGAVSSAIFLCDSICAKTKIGRKPGVVALCIVMSILGIISIILTIMQRGYSDTLWGLLICAIFPIVHAVDELKVDDEYQEKSMSDINAVLVSDLDERDEAFQKYIDSKNAMITQTYNRLESSKLYPKYIEFKENHPYNEDYNGNINPYNGKEITCAEDYDEYLMMAIDEKAKKSESKELSMIPLPDTTDPQNTNSKKRAKCRKKRNFKMLVLIILIPMLVISGGIGCYYSYQVGFDKGGVVGWNNGHREGYFSGYDEGHSKGYDEGHSKGYKEGYRSISDEYNFFHKYAVIVTTTGSKYHRYDCHYVENSDIYIYNIENAKYKGYTPCSDCFQ